jgi:hypothetical protein
MAVAMQQHRKILDAVGAGDADTAEEAMRIHLSQIEKTLPLLSRRHPELFEQPLRANEVVIGAGVAEGVETVTVDAVRRQRRSDKPAILRPARRTPA